MFPSGLWYNELGSVMQLNVSGGNVWGWYYSAVGNAQSTYQLAGSINPKPYPFSQVLGWAVSWTNAYKNAHSVTSWSGQYQTIDGQEEIVAFWLLTSETPEEQDWEATQIGKDVFTRTMPPQDAIEKSRKRTAKPHPPDDTQ